MIERIRIFFNKLFRTHKPIQTKSRFVSDDIYNQRRKEKQAIVDSLLDKISKNGADYYEIAKKEMRIAILDVLDAEDKNSDLAPYIQTPAQQLSGLYNSGIVIGSGNNVDATILQERLEYYQSSKTELWWQ